MKVDTHVILMPNTQPDWWKECRNSLEQEPINLHIVQGVKGHIGVSRAEGFTIGESPYISYVDPDDLVIKGAFQACIDALDKMPEACGAYTSEYLINEKGETIRPGFWHESDWNPLLQLEPQYLHNICVMRRKFVGQYLDEFHKWPHLSEFILKGLLTSDGPWIHINRFGYKWRIHGANSHKSFPLMGLYAARWRIIPTLLRAAKKYGAGLPMNE